MSIGCFIGLILFFLFFPFQLVFRLLALLFKIKKINKRFYMYGDDMNGMHDHQDDDESWSQKNDTSQTTQAKSKHEKVFKDDEGEYVDFEELK